MSTDCPDNCPGCNAAGTEEEPHAHYERADASKFPAAPAGQQAAIEGMLAAGGYLAAGHNRDRDEFA